MTRLSAAILWTAALIACDDAKRPTVDPLTPEDVTVNIGGVDFVRFEGGTFTIGREGFVRSHPPVEVTVRPFLLMKTEVTTGRYLRCMREGGCERPNDMGSDCTLRSSQTADLELPINCVSWNNAQQFATWFGHGARLPTEAEWTFAATGGTGRPYPWGYEPPDCSRVAREAGFLPESEPSLCGESRRLQPPCSRPLGNTPSPRIVCDLSGNVSELVQDDYHPTFDCDNPPMGDHHYESFKVLCEGQSRVPADGSAWVHDPPTEAKGGKGGNFQAGASDTWTVWQRGTGSTTFGSLVSGFRLAMDPPEVPPRD